MIKKLTFRRQKIFFVFCLFTTLLFGTYGAHAQTQPGISLVWDNMVGCQIYGYEKEREIFLEDIGDSECLRFCEYSQVTYTLVNLPPGASTSWNVTGGVISSSNTTNCIVTWGAVGQGNVSFTITNGNSIITKNLCVEKIIAPKAFFEVAPLGSSQPIYTCTNQSINFINLSETNNGTSLVSYYWDFGDGTSSTAFEPSHTYTQDNSYIVTLTVRNACNCTSSYELEVIAKRDGFEISCPTVICEGQSEIYSLPFDGMEICNGNFDWTVDGGQILSQAGGNVEVLWNSVDENGFGYVTFNPQDCQLECLEPTTIKIPVIQTNGTIKGPTDLCLGEQGRYSLPQWPTTDFQWQIIGNVGNNLAEIFQTDQRNEIIVNPNVSGTLVLRATYTNTLLHCSGEAEFTINVGEPLEIFGEDVTCQFENQPYSTTVGVPVNWTLTSNNGALIETQNNTAIFDYTFNQAGNFILTASASGYCAGEQKTITVIGKPNAPTGIAGDLLVCPNSLYTYTVDSPEPTSNYYWEVTNGSIVGDNTGDEVNVIFSALPAEVKAYKKTISPLECISDPYTITVNQIPVNVEIVSPLPYALCANSLASYQAVVPGTPNLYADGDTYTWSFVNSSSSILASSLGSVTNGQGTNAINVTWNNVSVVTTLDLVLTVSKCNISPAPQFVRQITLFPKTEIEIIASANPVCGGSAVTFTVQSANGVPLSPSDVITWNTGSGDFTTPAGQVSLSTTYSNNSTVNIGQVVTAYIANSNNCGQTNTFSYALTVLPNPPAIATLTSASNAFCTPQEIDATITASSAPAGATNFQWLYNGSPISGATGTSLHVLFPMQAGAYTFQAMNQSGCVSVSNPVYINIVSCTPPNCTISETLQNNSVLTGCGQITFIGTASGSPINEVWQVLGPSPTDYSINGNVLTGKPGNYKIVYQVFYPCQEGGTGYIVNIKDVVIPYEPDFFYVVECTAGNTFNVNFIDNSTFYAQVTSPVTNFYYKAAGAPTFTGPIAYDPSLAVFELQNLAAGNYVFRLEISGTQANTPTFTCSKEYTVNLQGVNPFLSIIINQNQQINCHNTAVKFELSNTVLGSTVIWDFDDDGAQNTLESPSRVFNTPDTTYNVTCTVTNQYGCSRVIPIQVYIPKECFFGDIVADPVNATVCKNETVELTYVSDNDNCTANNNYVWMNGSEVVVGAPNSSQLTVNTTGFYWVKVISEDGCEYASPTQIKPVFNTFPNVKLFGESTFCEGEEVKLQVSTSATTIRWFIDGNLYSQFNDQLQAILSTVLSAGNYVVLVEVTSADGCTNAATQTISIEEAIHHIDMDVSIQCTPYEVTITANPQPANAAITYNWSNGATTQSIVVTDGGPYKVTATLGGCSFSQVIDVPKNPENYIWIFPTGCYTDCSTDLNYLIGPTLPLQEWSWNLNGQSDQSGGGSYATPYTLLKDGSYTFTLNTGECALESAPLDYSTTRCDKCKIETATVKEVTVNDTPYCSFTYTLAIYSTTTTPYQATIIDDMGNVLIIPSSFTLVGGPNYIQFTVIPQNPFTGGTTHWTIQGSVPGEFGYEDCFYDFDVRVKTCDGFSTKIGNMNGDKTANLVVETQEIKIYPNPAKDNVTISYSLNTSTATLEIYDLAGRSISQKVLSSSTGEEQIQTSTYQAGIYIVVVKENDTILLQQKLIIE